MSLLPFLLSELQAQLPKLSPSEAERFARAIERQIEQQDRLDVPDSLIRTKIPRAIQLMVAQNYSSIENAAQYILQVLLVQIGDDPASMIPEEFQDRCPYPGLAAFSERQTALFHGRSADSTKLLQSLDRQLLVVTGPSGVGKSSFIFAGITPQLPKQFGEHTIVLSYRVDSGAAVLDELATVLARHAAGLAEDVAAAFDSHDAGLLEALQRLHSSRNERIFLIIDQFEALFVGDDPARKHARQRLLDNLLAVETSALPFITIILVSRENYFEHEDYTNRPRLLELVQRENFPLGALSASQLRQAIEVPLQLFNQRYQQRLTFQEGLVDLILQSFQQSTIALPLVQYLLRLLWVEKHRLTHFAYNSLGGIERVLDRHASTIYDTFPEATKPIVKAMLIALVRLGLGDEYTRKRIPRAYLLGIGVERQKRAAILERLSDARSRIVSEQQIGETVYVELTHEVLLRQWGFLRELIEARKERIEERERLLPSAEQWVQSQLKRGARGDPSYLYRGDARRRAHRYIATAQLAEDIDPAIAACYATSKQYYRRNLITLVCAVLIGMVLIGGGFLFTQRELAAAQQQRVTAQAEQRIAQQQAHARATGEAIAQAQAYANATAQAIARAQADVNATAQVVAQGQADINATAQVVAQGQANANATAQAEERARADLNATSQAQARAEADRNATAQVIAERDSAANATARALAQAKADQNATAQASAEKQAAANATAEALAKDQAAQNATAEALQRQRAESQRLASLVQQELIRDPEVALLLAYESLATNHNPLSEQAIRDAMAYLPFVPTNLIADARHTPMFNIQGTHMLFQHGSATELRALDGRLIAALPGSGMFSLDGNYVVTEELPDFDAVQPSASVTRLWELTGQQTAVLTGTLSSVQPFGQQRLLTIDFVSQTDNIYLWDLAGRNLKTFTGQTAAFNSDGSLLVISDEQFTPHFYDLSGQPVASGSADVLHEGTFSPSGNLIYTDAAGPAARLLDRTGAEVAIFEASVDPGSAVEFSADEQFILTYNGASVATDRPRLWDTTGTLLATFSDDEADMSPDGQRILTWDRLGKATRLYDRYGTQLTRFNGVYGHFMPDGRSVLTWSENGPVRVWNEVTTLSSNSFRVEGSAIENVVFSHDGQRFLTIIQDGGVILWDRQHNQLATFDGREALFSSDDQYILTHFENGTRGDIRDAAGVRQRTWSGKQIIFSANGQRILVVPASGSPEIWSSSGQRLATIAGDTNQLSFLHFSPSGAKILATLRGETTWVFDDTGAKQATVRGTNPVVSLDDRTIVTIDFDLRAGGEQGSIYISNMNGTLLATLYGSLAVVSPDGQTVLVGGESGKLTLYDLAGGQQRAFQGHQEVVRIEELRFNPNGLQMLSTGVERTLLGPGKSEAILWHLSGQKIATFDRAFDAIFSPDGQYVLVWYADQTVGIYTLQGFPITTLRDVQQTVAFDQRGDSVFAITTDGVLQEHLLNPHDLLAMAACRMGRELTADEIARYALGTPTFSFATRQCPPLPR